MKLTAKGFALGLIFGGLGAAIAYIFIGETGWQTGLATGVGVLLGRAIAGDFDSKVPQIDSSNSKKFDIPTQELSEAEQLNNLAYQLSMTGNLKQAMDHWAKSALAGVPNALASYSWHALREGEFQNAITLYEASISNVLKSKDSYQIANCKGNYALNILAHTGNVNLAKNLLQETIRFKHHENHFYLVMLEYKYGDKGLAITMFQDIPKDTLDQMEKSFVEEYLAATGWFKVWNQEARELLVKFRNHEIA